MVIQPIRPTASVVRRAAVHAALGDLVRLAIVDDLVVSDRSPRELCDRWGLSSNLLAHHLDVLEEVGLVARTGSTGDRRRKYVRLVGPMIDPTAEASPAPDVRSLLFLCSHNSARSQLAAALWCARTGGLADSAGTRPAPRVHPRAVRAARRAGIDLRDARPRQIGEIPTGTQVVTVCDRVHEELDAEPGWWHWSLPDPAEIDTDAAFDAVVAALDERIAAVTSRSPRHSAPWVVPPRPTARPRRTRP